MEIRSIEAAIRAMPILLLLLLLLLQQYTHTYTYTSSSNLVVCLSGYFLTTYGCLRVEGSGIFRLFSRAGVTTTAL